MPTHISVPGLRSTVTVTLVAAGKSSHLPDSTGTGSSTNVHHHPAVGQYRGSGESNRNSRYPPAPGELSTGRGREEDGGEWEVHERYMRETFREMGVSFRPAPPVVAGIAATGPNAGGIQRSPRQQRNANTSTQTSEWTPPILRPNTGSELSASDTNDSFRDYHQAGGGARTAPTMEPGKLKHPAVRRRQEAGRTARPPLHGSKVPAWLRDEVDGEGTETGQEEGGERSPQAQSQQFALEVLEDEQQRRGFELLRRVMDQKEKTEKDRYRALLSLDLSKRAKPTGLRPVVAGKGVGLRSSPIRKRDVSPPSATHRTPARTRATGTRHRSPLRERLRQSPVAKAPTAAATRHKEAVFHSTPRQQHKSDVDNKASATEVSAQEEDPPHTYAYMTKMCTLVQQCLRYRLSYRIKEALVPCLRIVDKGLPELQRHLRVIAAASRAKDLKRVLRLQPFVQAKLAMDRAARQRDYRYFAAFYTLKQFVLAKQSCNVRRSLLFCPPKPFHSPVVPVLVVHFLLRCRRRAKERSRGIVKDTRHRCRSFTTILRKGRVRVGHRVRQGLLQHICDHCLRRYAPKAMKIKDENDHAFVFLPPPPEGACTEELDDGEWTPSTPASTAGGDSDMDLALSGEEEVSEVVPESFGARRRKKKTEGEGEKDEDEVDETAEEQIYQRPAAEEERKAIASLDEHRQRIMAQQNTTSAGGDAAFNLPSLVQLQADSEIQLLRWSTGHTTQLCSESCYSFAEVIAGQVTKTPSGGLESRFVVNCLENMCNPCKDELVKDYLGVRRTLRAVCLLQSHYRWKKMMQALRLSRKAALGGLEPAVVQQQVSVTRGRCLRCQPFLDSLQQELDRYVAFNKAHFKKNSPTKKRGKNSPVGRSESNLSPTVKLQAEQGRQELVAKVNALTYEMCTRCREVATAKFREVRKGAA